MTRTDLALAALACAAVPGMRPVSVRERREPAPDGQQPTHQSALVEDATGRRWVISCPLTAVAAAELERNDSLVRQLGRHLPFKIPAAAGYASLGTLGRAAVFPYVEGSALDLHWLPGGPGLASAIGRALAAVHNIPTGLFEEHAVPVFDAAAHRSRRLAELDRAAETGHVPTGLLARWEQAFDAPSVWQFLPTPVHGALDGWSFLVAFSDADDASTGRVVGLTGWGHAAVTDPAEDFIRLVHEAPPAAVDSVLESYALARSQRPDPHLLTRARLGSEMQWVRGLAAAVAAEDDAGVALRVDQLRKLERLTTADDPLVPPQRLDPAGGEDDAVVQVSHESAPVALPVDRTQDLRGQDEHGGRDVSPEEGDQDSDQDPDPDPDHTETIPPVGGSPRTGSTAVASSRDLAQWKRPQPLGEGPDSHARLHDLYGMPEEGGQDEDDQRPGGAPER